MSDSSWLYSRTQKFCPHCGEELVCAVPEDLLAVHPLELELHCTRCGAHQPPQRTRELLFQSIDRQLIFIPGGMCGESAPNAVGNDNAQAPGLGYPAHEPEPPSSRLH